MCEDPEKGNSWGPLPRTETKEVQPFFKLAVMGIDQSDTHSHDPKSWELDKRVRGYVGIRVTVQTSLGLFCLPSLPLWDGSCHFSKPDPQLPGSGEPPTTC